MHIPDLSEKTYNTHDEDGFEYRSVGWLGDEVTRRGDTEPTVVATLRFLWDVNQLIDSWRGVHTCGICGGEHCKGEFFVEDHVVRYVLPNMVLHYIEAHHYKLPDVVEAAVRRSALFSKDDWQEYCVKKDQETAPGVEAFARQKGEIQGRKEGLRLGMAAGRKAGFVDGKLEGKRDALYRLLVRAGMVLADAERGRIQACADEAILDRWVERVLEATTPGEVLS